MRNLHSNICTNRLQIDNKAEPEAKGGYDEGRTQYLITRDGSFF